MRRPTPLLDQLGAASLGVVDQVAALPQQRLPENRSTAATLDRLQLAAQFRRLQVGPFAQGFEPIDRPLGQFGLLGVTHTDGVERRLTGPAQ